MALTKETIKDKFVQFVYRTQNGICSELEQCDGKAFFKKEEWQRQGGGGGITMVMENGNVFEKAGVNTSVVHGKVTDAMRNQLNINGDTWFACGISGVIHPANPFVPAIHFNFRYFELYNESGALSDCWFGGGTDLTPFYLITEDVKHFHATYKNVCDAFNHNFYPAFKKQCDDYFVNRHRHNERRGVGGIFYDYQRPNKDWSSEFWLDFASACAGAFSDAYLQVAIKRKDAAFTKQQKHWQEIRRGRYVEFNLLHDRGTLFGLKTNGRTESILMSLPPTVRFEYDHKPEPNSEEAKLLKVLMQPANWI